MGHLVGGRALPAPRHELVAAQPPDVGFEHHEGLDPFPHFFVRHSHDAGRHDGVMLLEDALNLGGGDTVALVLDHVDGAVHEVEPALVVDADDVLDAVPDLSIHLEEAFPGLLGLVPVLWGGVLAGAQQLPGLSLRNPLEDIDILPYGSRCEGTYFFSYCWEGLAAGRQVNYIVLTGEKKDVSYGKKGEGDPCLLFLT